MILLDDLSAAEKQLRLWLKGRDPELAIVLGSGLAALAEQLEEPISLPFSALPGFPDTAVAGHGGQLLAGRLCGRSVLVFCGRYHCYEGFSAWQVTAQVRLAAKLGCAKLLLTNASGGIAAELQAGDFMVVTDHLNLSGANPLTGRPEIEFLDLNDLYRKDFFLPLRQQLVGQDIRLHLGVLAWMAGPSYETPAEVRMLSQLGADAVSMSTIPEAIVGRLCGMETVAIAFISNMAAGLSGEKLLHEEVLAAGQQAAERLYRLLGRLLSVWR